MEHLEIEAKIITFLTGVDPTNGPEEVFIRPVEQIMDTNGANVNQHNNIVFKAKAMEGGYNKRIFEKENPSKLLIVTGPQGSGNHLWAKVFSMHPSVNGWPMLKDEREGHHDEPMNEYWQEPSKLSELEIGERNKYITSISCPYFKNKQPQIPNYADFVKHAKQKFDEVKMCVIGRDRDIIEMQQTRVRGEHVRSLQTLERRPLQLPPGHAAPLVGGTAGTET